MPLPQPSFTKSKWLAFFAELTAKINHHNPVVVIEGCDVVRRLLTTRVSVGAFLEEGTCIQYLLDVIEGVTRVERPPTSLDIEMLDALLRVLFLMIDMMASLAFDNDAYYLLLVVARASVMLKSLTKVLQCNTRLHFGRCCYYVHVLLSIPLTSALRQDSLDEAVMARNVTLQSHVRALKEALLQYPQILAELTQTTLAVSHACQDGAVCAAAQRISSMSQQQERRFQRHRGDVQGAATSVPGAASYPFADPSMQDSVDMTGGSATTATGDAILHVSHQQVGDILTSFGHCKSHNDFFEAMNRLWCVTVAARDVVADATSNEAFQPLLRFLTKAPLNGVDRVLFASILSWLAVLGSMESLHRDLLDAIAALVPSHWMPMSAAAAQRADAYTTSASCAPSLSSSTVKWGEVSSTGNLVHSHRSNSTATMAEPTPPTPSIVLHVLSFMVFLERTCTPDSMSAWMRGSLIGMLDKCIAAAGSVKSILIDAPTTADGSLSDEAYLACALESARTENVTLAATACKLMNAVMSNFGDLLMADFSVEVGAMVEVLVPQLLGIVLRNPTLSAAAENKPGSILHHVHRCHRALRSTSLGECAAGAMDACLALINPTDLEMTKLRDMVLLVPALTRATRCSVVPHIRALVYRVLIRVCCSPAHLVLTVREMPSVLSTAVKCILSVNASEPQWECAAAAEWLARVIAIAATDSSIEPTFDLGQTALPIRLLQLTAPQPIGCTSAAMLNLCTAIFEQQQRIMQPPHNHRSDASGPTSHGTVLAPLGRKSLQLWCQVAHASAQANRSLAKVSASIQPTHCSTRDVFGRSLAVYEDIAAQFTYTAAVARGMQYMVELDPAHRDGLGDAMVYEFVTAAVAAPPPTAVQQMVSVRFGVACPAPTSILRRAHDAMVQAVMGLFGTWVSPSALQPFEPLPQGLLLSVVELMCCESVPASTRAHLAKLVNATHTTPGQATLRNSCEDASGAMFEASLALNTEAPIVAAMRCRLLSEHVGASAAALTSGWLEEAVATPLYKIGLVAEKHHELSSVADVGTLQVVMSYAASFFANRACVPLPSALTEKFAAAWLRLLRLPPTQAMAFQSIPYLMRSAAGRQVALCECIKSGEPYMRCCAGYAAFVALPYTSLTNHASGVRGGRVGGNHSGVGAGSATKQKHHAQMRAVAMEGLTTAIALETDPFARWLIKIRSVDVLEDIICTADQQHAAPPLAEFKLLAAASFCTDTQTFIGHRAGLLTAILAVAEDKPTAEVGVLALLILRNLCFNTTLKIQMCQDTRVLYAMRNALLSQSSSNSNPRQLGDPAKAPLLPLELCSEVLQRQEIAARCFWALTHNNERGKAYVRGVLQRGPQTEPAPPKSALRVTAPSMANALAPPDLLPGAGLRIPQFRHSGSELTDYTDLMEESLRALTQLEIIKVA